MHEVLVNRFGGLSLPRKSVVRLTDRPDMTLGVYRGRKTTIQQQQQQLKDFVWATSNEKSYYLHLYLHLLPVAEYFEFIDKRRYFVLVFFLRRNNLRVPVFGV